MPWKITLILYSFINLIWLCKFHNQHLNFDFLHLWTYKTPIILFLIFIIVGTKENSEKLNKTLLFLITLLNDNNIKNWFVCYGTLLGLVRENSFIDNDIDIITEKINYDIIKKILI